MYVEVEFDNEAQREYEELMSKVSDPRFRSFETVEALVEWLIEHKAVTRFVTPVQSADEP